MTIHADHPFPGEDDPVRRFRGRATGVVSLWTTSTAGAGAGWAGLTVSSFLVANGDPAHVLGLVDPDSAVGDAVDDALDGPDGARLVVALLEWEHRDLADAFAGQTPAPGGAFRLGSWTQTAWGPVLDGASAWVGLRVGSTSTVGFSTLLDGVVEHVHVGDSSAPLVHRRGRYQRPS